MSTWGIVPATGEANRRPAAHAGGLSHLPSRSDGDAGIPTVRSEYLVERMIEGGATNLCFVISPGESNLVQHYGDDFDGVAPLYLVQPRPAGLCDALFRAAAVIGPTDHVLMSLPDTVWYPVDGFASLPDDRLSLLLFHVTPPHHFEGVVIDGDDRVEGIAVKGANSPSPWVWGAVKMPGLIFHSLHELWLQRGAADLTVGSLVNAYVASGGQAWGVRAGLSCVAVNSTGHSGETREMLDHAPAAGAPTRRSPGYTDGWRPLTAAKYVEVFPEQRIDADVFHRLRR